MGSIQYFYTIREFMLYLKLNNAMKVQDIFNANVQEYEKWFDNHEYVYESELLAIRQHMEELPALTQGIEVGLGTGRFAKPLGIKEGIEPAAEMRALAIRRGLEVMDGKVENLPYRDMHFDFVLMVTLMCYLPQPLKALKETYRVLKQTGRLILAFIDGRSIIGKSYRERQARSVFYKQAHFYRVDEVLMMLKQARFKNLNCTQTLFQPLDEINELEPVKEGYGEGSFVVVSAFKQ